MGQADPPSRDVEGPHHAEALDELGWVVVAGDRHDRSERGELVEDEGGGDVTGMHDDLDRRRAQPVDERTGQAPSEMGEMRVGDDADDGHARKVPVRAGCDGDASPVDAG